MTDEELAELAGLVERERERRRRLEQVQQERAALIARVDALLLEIQQLDGVQAGAEWVPPVSASGAYPLGAVVTWEGRTWENITPSNPHQPGVSGWAIVPEVDPETGEDVPPPFVRPAGAHDAYKAGKRITWEDGETYEAVRDGVVHTPDEHAASWLLIEAEVEEPEPTGPDEDDETSDPEPEPEPEAPAIPEWEVGATYKIGDELTYQGVHYRLIQNHTSAAHWPPGPGLESIYEVV